MATFGQLLTDARRRRGLAQNAVARATRINVGTVNRLERDQRMPASRAQVLKLATALNLTALQTDQLLHAAGMTCKGCPAARYFTEGNAP
jgi:transcriptional regulator with XRE-family HTH domain